AVWLIFGNDRAREPRMLGRGTERDLTDARGEHYHYEVPLALGAIYSLGVGFVSSFLGIGGGIIHVPLLVRALGFPTHIPPPTALATPPLVLPITAGTASSTHLATYSFSAGHGLRRATALSIGVVIGAQLGAHISLHLSARTIQVLLGVALAVLAVRLLVPL